MSSISKTDQLSARISVKVPRPDSLVEVRVTPPDSSFQVKVGPGEDVIELLIRPGASLVEVRISPPDESESEDECDRLRGPDSGGEDETPPEDEALSGVSKAEFAAMVEEAESAEAKKLLDRMAEEAEVAAESPPAPDCRRPDEPLLGDEALSLEEERPLEAPADPAEPEALELSPETAAEILPAAPEDSVGPVADELEETGVEGPAPEDLSEAGAPADLSPMDADILDQLAVAGPDPEELTKVMPPTEPDEFDRPDEAEPTADEAAQAAGTSPADEDELDEFDRPDELEPTADEAVQAAGPSEADGDEPDEFDRPDELEPTVDAAVQAAGPSEADEVEPEEFELPDELEPMAVDAAPAAVSIEPEAFAAPELASAFEALSLENDEVRLGEQSSPAEAKPAALAEPSASQTLEWVPVNPSGVPLAEEASIAPEVVGAAALDALARLNLAVQEEQAAIEAAILPAERPQSGEATAAASFFARADSTFTSADSTIMVEMYDDYEPGPNPADTMTPPPEDELMDLSQVEKDEDLAIEPIDVDGLGELDLEKSHFAETRNGAPAIKARPMVQVIPGNTVVPE